MESITPPQKGTLFTVEQAMKLAVSEASRGAVYASPNPLVGCVVLNRRGQFLASGYHERCGGPHAEVNAIKKISPSDLDGAHVIVTLEPCAHEGKTPSCAKMLANLPIKKVTYGLIDPNPLVSGQGINILKAANKEVCQYTGDLNLSEVCEMFLWNQKKKRPFVSLKLATSLDGKIALKNGESQWITGPKARSHSHYLRAIHDAVGVGIQTVLMDNPSLTIRDFKTDKENKIIIFDSKGRSLNEFSKLRLFKEHSHKSIYILVSKDFFDLQPHPYSEDLNIIYCPTLSNGLLDLEWILDVLYKKNIYSLFVEGGAKLSSQLISNNHINRLYIFQAPCLIGGTEGVGWTDSLQISSLSQKKILHNLTIESYEPDLLITGLLKNE